MRNLEKFTIRHYVFFGASLVASLFLCLCIGSVSIPAGEIVAIIRQALGGQAIESPHSSIILAVRLPRVLNVALVGGGLALSGATMQGLLRNPLAEGGTLGISAGAGLGAVLAIALGIQVPFIPFGGTVVMAILFAFLSLLMILFLSYKLDYSLSTQTIILLGVIYSMFVSSIQSLIMVLSSNKLESITSWNMGSLSGSSYQGGLLMGLVLLVSAGLIYSRARELDAFAISEENAAHIGVEVRQVKLVLMMATSAIIGVTVAFSGIIGFVGLIIPHIMRRIFGPGHRKLLVASLFGGAIFLLYADLLARTIMNPIEVPIGIITSFIGSILFINIYFSMGRLS